MIYLDNAATTRVAPEVLEAMMPYLTDQYGNAGATYSFGVSARQAVEKAREQVAAYIRADNPEQVIFTSGGTESNNWVFDIWEGLDVLVSKVEHDSVLRSALGRRKGKTHYIDVKNDGSVDLDDLRKKIAKPDTLVSVMYVNNELGTINDIESVGKICKEDNQVLFHCDAVQAPGCVVIDVNKIKCDYLSLSSHKLHGPKGVGVLYARRPEALDPMIVGGHNQEFGLRGGTENVPGIVGLGKACELMASKQNFSKIVDHTSFEEIKRAFYTRLLACLMGSTSKKRVRVRVNGDSLDSHGKVLNIRFDGIDAETLVLIAGAHGLCISAGSACRSREQEPSHVLSAIGLSDDEARSSVRISFSTQSTLAEAREGAQILAKALCAYCSI